MPDLDETRFSRECDYCGTCYASVRCVHQRHQEPCPHCDVMPQVQFA
jgi:hypothetical protein